MAEKKPKEQEKEKKVERKEEEVGEMIHFFDKISVGVVKASKEIKKGDKIHIKGSTTDFDETVDSLQIDHKDVESIKKGEEAGMKVAEKVREGDKVYKIVE